VLNTTEEEVEVTRSTIEVEQVGYLDQTSVNAMGSSKDRFEKVIGKLRPEHLNVKERRSLEGVCFDYQDVFFLPGDWLSCTKTVKHSIHLETGTTPINTRPYRLPESQKAEIDKQVNDLVQEGIIVKKQLSLEQPNSSSAQMQ
jgi:hypothetical protein